MHGFDSKTLKLGWVLAGVVACCSGSASAQTEPLPSVSSLSLKNVPVPGPSADVLSQFVADKTAAIQLGKALFWDQRVGSDNKTACASCHFAAGADNRVKNQVSPGMLRLGPDMNPAPDNTFQVGSAPNYTPNYTLSEGDFPLTKFLDLNDASTRMADVNDVISSQGVFATSTAPDARVTVSTSATPDACAYVLDDVYHGDGFSINGINTRRVEPRNSPSVINAVFNFRNFWDGRGNNVFNGGDPFGLRNPQPQVWKLVNGSLTKVSVAIPSSSLASQGSGPPLSGTEMSCRNRAFVMLGQKLLGQKILAGQTIAVNDSVLGAFSSATLRPLYRGLVMKAFRPEWWQATAAVRFTTADATAVGSMDLRNAPQSRLALNMSVGQMEANFSLFFALAIQMYESTLVADDSPFDRYAAGSGALSADQQAGLSIFMGKGRCINCHGGAELTNASFRNVLGQRLESMVMANGVTKVYDNGFYNIGVRPYTDDIGVGGNDPWKQPLSETLMVLRGWSSQLGNGFNSAANPTPAADKVNVTGAFKTPGLRNVELTGPYFHNGGKATLMQVVDFYNRGGDFAVENRDFLAPDIRPIGLSDLEKGQLVSFLLSLTDERVRWQKAPFDHPSLCLPQGEVEYMGGVKPDSASNSMNATDVMSCMQEVGAGGSSTPLQPFLSLSPMKH